MLAFENEPANETNRIRLDVRVRSSVEKFCNPPRLYCLGIVEISLQVFQCLHRAVVREQRTELRCHVRDAAPVIAKQVKQVVSVLVLPSNVEGIPPALP